MAKVEFNYDKNEDILYLFNGAKNVKFSLDFHDIYILDFDEKNHVVGLEIIDASKVLYFKKEALSNLKEVEMTARFKDGIMAVLIILRAEQMKPVQTTIPIPLAIK